MNHYTIIHNLLKHKRRSKDDSDINEDDYSVKINFLHPNFAPYTRLFKAPGIPYDYNIITQNMKLYPFDKDASINRHGYTRIYITDKLQEFGLLEDGCVITDTDENRQLIRRVIQDEIASKLNVTDDMDVIVLDTVTRDVKSSDSVRAVHLAHSDFVCGDDALYQLARPFWRAWKDKLQEQTQNSELDLVNLREYEFLSMWNSWFCRERNKGERQGFPLAILDKTSSPPMLFPYIALTNNEEFISRGIKHNANQRWMTISNLNPGEGFMFDTCSTPHTAIKLPHVKMNSDPRHSIECRTMVIRKKMHLPPWVPISLDEEASDILLEHANTCKLTVDDYDRFLDYTNNKALFDLISLVNDVCTSLYKSCTEYIIFSDIIELLMVKEMHQNLVHWNLKKNANQLRLCHINLPSQIDILCSPMTKRKQHIFKYFLMEKRPNVDIAQTDTSLTIEKNIQLGFLQTLPCKAQRYGRTRMCVPDLSAYIKNAYTNDANKASFLSFLNCIVLYNDTILPKST
tara:strand:- start:344 stop:1888 length:1545 start_codon:yes stop_codon:yes gene_type:complete